MERFVPRKRIAVDGVSWWCVWDNLRRCWSPYFCHGVYRTQKAARLAIVRGNEKWSEYLNKGVKYYGKR